jgi:hypothetical protein
VLASRVYSPLAVHLCVCLMYYCNFILIHITNKTMWITPIVLMLSMLLFVYIVRRKLSIEKAATCPQISTLILLIFYFPIFLVKGLIPAILAARKYYGPTFCLHILGVKWRIFFITEHNGRNAISKNTHLRLPAAHVAQLFGLSEKVTGRKR